MGVCLVLALPLLHKQLEALQTVGSLPGRDTGDHRPIGHKVVPKLLHILQESLDVADQIPLEADLRDGEDPRNLRRWDLMGSDGI